MTPDPCTDAINRVSTPDPCTDAINRVSTPDPCTDAINRVPTPDLTKSKKFSIKTGELDANFD
ncbi:MAG: hypothetical protein KME40_04080 [Komarekiella atlantica HA4396-MV6]|jgi:hypothetical protein|nr:hypothetical protein [Komarekiella atlantica HA4396-MV6]